MSTKIYYARRVPLSRLNELIDKMRPQVIDMIAEKVGKLMGYVEVSEPIPDGVLVGRQDSWRRFKQFELVLKLCEEAGRRPERDIWDIDCGINIWINGHYAYIIPIFPEYDMLDKLKWPKWSEDYSYWNNTDTPDGVSQKEFDARGKMWGKINCGSGTADHNSRRLYHAFVDTKDGLFMGTWDVGKKLFPDRFGA